MPLSRAQLTRHLEASRLRRTSLLRQLMQPDPIVIGNVYDVLRRCGNPSCHCAKKPGHLQTLLIYTEKGRRQCRFVRQKDADWVKKAWQHYRSLRKALKEVRDLNNTELGLLRSLIRLRSVKFPV